MESWVIEATSVMVSPDVEVVIDDLHSRDSGTPEGISTSLQRRRDQRGCQGWNLMRWPAKKASLFVCVCSVAIRDLDDMRSKNVWNCSRKWRRYLICASRYRLQFWACNCRSTGWRESGAYETSRCSCNCAQLYTQVYPTGSMTPHSSRCNCERKQLHCIWKVVLCKWSTMCTWGDRQYWWERDLCNCAA